MWYDVSTDEGYEDLYRLLTKQPRVIKPKLGTLKSLPSRKQKQDFSAASDDSHTKDRSPIPPLLPYLPDCHLQEDALDSLIGKLKPQSPYPIVCIIHGDEYQSHDMFVERLKEFSLPKILSLDPKQKITDYAPSWPGEFESSTEFHNKFRKNLSEEICGHRSKTQEEINHRLVEHRAPVLVHIHLLTDDWIKYGSEIIENLLDFWQNWPSLSHQQYLFICLFLKYQTKEKRNFFIKYDSCKKYNKRISEFLNDLTFSHYNRLEGKVFPKFEGVTKRDTEEWARKKAKKYGTIEDRLKKVREIYTQWEKANKINTIPMEHLASQLKECILQEYTNALRR